jgi:outer membrane protein TolC
MAVHLFGALIAALLAPPPVPLDADAYVRRVLARSPVVAVAAAERTAAAARVDAATRRKLPRVELQAKGVLLSATEESVLGHLVAAPPGTPDGVLAPGTPLVNVPVSVGGGPETLWGLGLKVGVPLSDHLLRLPQASRAAEAGRAAAEAEAARAQADATLNAALDYHTWVDACARRKVADEAVALLQAHRADAEARRAQGVATAADVSQIDAALAAAEVDALRAAQGAEITESRLRIALGDAPDTHYTAEAPAPPAVVVETASALEQRPEHRALAQAVLAAQARAEVESARRWPRLDAFGEATYGRPGDRTFPPSDAARGAWQAGLVLSFGLTDAYEGAAEAEAYAASAAAAQAQLAAVDEALRLQVERARQGVRAADASVTAGARGVAAAEEALRVRVALSTAGQATTTERLTAELALTEARRALLQARTAQFTARAELSRAAP